MKSIHIISFILVILGGLNWGLIALGDFVGSNWNVVNLILKSTPTTEAIVYLLIGLGTLVLLFTHKKGCDVCSTKSVQGTSQKTDAPMGM